LFNYTEEIEACHSGTLCARNDATWSRLSTAGNSCSQPDYRAEPQIVSAFKFNNYALAIALLMRDAYVGQRTGKTLLPNRKVRMKDSKTNNTRHGRSIRKLTRLALALFAFCTSLLNAEDLHIMSFHQLTPSQGWVVANDHLLFTDSAGARWSEITPPAGHASIDGVFFMDRATGWTVVSTTGEQRDVQLARTTDGGAHWAMTGLSILNQDGNSASYGGKATISFADRTDGWILLHLVSSSNFSLGVLLQTTDGGATWTRLPNPPIADGLAFVTRQQGWLSGGPDSKQIFVTRDGGHTWRASRVPPPAGGAPRVAKELQISEGAKADLQSKVQAIVPDAGLARAQLGSSGDGWMEAVAGGCTGFKTGCSQNGHLLAVNAGVVTEITPSIVLQRGPSSAATIVLSSHLGFDKCTAAAVSDMQTWWNNSPYRDVNIYIGGSTRACSQANLTASWVTSIFNQGWKLIPTWVGPQAPCFGGAISTNTSTAFNQGISEASAAVSAANGLGLNGSIIYYDMEHYDQTASGCQAAVDSFINGWTQQLHSSGFRAGVYGSPFDIAAGWATVANVPDDVWIAAWNGSTSTTGLSPLSDSLWSNHQRIHQYQGGHNETYGGITFNIDNDSEDGQVASESASTDPSSPSGTSSCSTLTGRNLTSYCDVPSVTIVCGGAIGSQNDLSGVPINWTFTNGNSTCVTVRYSFGYNDARQTCSYYLYVPNGEATTTIQATLSDGTHQSFNENPVSGWQHWFDATGISSLTFTDGNGTTNQQMGWGRTSSVSIERLCSL
jgi:hypothetical protein